MLLQGYQIWKVFQSTNCHCNNAVLYLRSSKTRQISWVRLDSARRHHLLPKPWPFYLRAQVLHMTDFFHDLPAPVRPGDQRGAMPFTGMARFFQKDMEVHQTMVWCNTSSSRWSHEHFQKNRQPVDWKLEELLVIYIQHRALVFHDKKVLPSLFVLCLLQEGSSITIFF